MATDNMEKAKRLRQPSEAPFIFRETGNTTTMPASITHELVARQAKEQLLSSEIAKRIDAAPEYYYLGAQGPDLLFFYRPLSRKEPNFGRMLHRERIYETTCAFLITLRRLTGDELKKAQSYVLGYISHCCTDGVFHPFVYNLLREIHGGRVEHQQIENDWDVYFLARHRGHGAEKYSFPFSLKEIAQEETLFTLWSSCAHILGRRTLSPAAFAASLKNFGRYLTFFHGRCYAQRRRLERLEKIFRIRGLSRLFPRGAPDRRVLFGEDFPRLAEGLGQNADDLFTLATTRSAERITTFMRCFAERTPLPREEFSVHLHTGKNI